MKGLIVLILNRQATELTIAIDVPTTITINSTKNSNGIIEKNDNDRNIVNYVDGIRRINKITILTGNILLFNDLEWVLFTNSVDFVQKTNINSYYGNLNIRDDKVLNYKIGASRFLNKNFIGNSLTITGFNSTTHSIFKVFKNGKETIDYTINTGGITFNSNSIYSTYIEVLFYPNSQIITTQSYEIEYNNQAVL